jgi:hypothetical protein
MERQEGMQRVDAKEEGHEAREGNNTTLSVPLASPSPFTSYSIPPCPL